MPNPFDFYGPEFLVFYIILGVLVVAAVAALRRRSEHAVGVTAPLTDYLKIAYLRGGPSEALRVAAVALMDRGLVEVVDDNCLKATPEKMPGGLQPTERRLLECCKDPARASEIVEDASLKVTVRTECEGQLVRAGLLPDDTVKANRIWLLFVGAVFLGIVALVKVLIALSRGRTNVGFLIISAVIFVFVLYRVANPLRTEAGEAMLADLRKLFSALQYRPAAVGPAGGSNELALLAAVFGISSLPAGRGSVVERLFRRPQTASSSCGSTSSCGSSCGGGGCGGGCGGCGS